MSFWGALGKIGSAALSLVPGGELIKTGVEAVSSLVSAPQRKPVTVSQSELRSIVPTAGTAVATSSLSAIPSAIRKITSLDRGLTNLVAQNPGSVGQAISTMAKLPALGAITTTPLAVLPTAISAIQNFGGGGGSMSTPATAQQYLNNAVLPASACKTYLRAPKGYVVITNKDNGTQYAVLKEVARKLKLWSPSPKPPISVKDWQCFKRSKAVEKKLRKIAGPALRKHSASKQRSTKGRKR